MVRVMVLKGKNNFDYKKKYEKLLRIIESHLGLQMAVKFESLVGGR